MSHLRYFAYGSNMLPQRLQRRVPSAQPKTTAYLTGYRLCFHKRGADDSAKCNVYYTGTAEDRVHGVVYTLAAAEKPDLDAAEGAGYEIHELEVCTPEETLRCFGYVASADYVDPELSPYTWYKQYVLQGARHHGLPRDYCETIACVSAVTDPLPERVARHRLVLGEYADNF